MSLCLRGLDHFHTQSGLALQPRGDDALHEETLGDEEEDDGDDSDTRRRRLLKQRVRHPAALALDGSARAV